MKCALDKRAANEPRQHSAGLVESAARSGVSVRLTIVGTNPSVPPSRTIRCCTLRTSSMVCSTVGRFDAAPVDDWLEANRAGMGSRPAGRMADGRVGDQLERDRWTDRRVASGAAAAVVMGRIHTSIGCGTRRVGRTAHVARAATSDDMADQRRMGAANGWTKKAGIIESRPAR